MAELAENPLNLKDFALVLDRLQQIHALPTGPELYPQLDAQFNQFHGCVLLSEYAFSANWSSYEMHPAGDEVLYLLSGRCELLLEQQGQTQRIRFDSPGQVQVIPKGCWHSADVRPGESCRILFFTPGAGSEQRPRR